MASIRRKGALWQVLTNVYRDGRRRQIARSFASERAAKVHRAKAELLEQRAIGTPRLSLGAYLAEWVQTKASDIEPTTLAGYRRWVGHIRRCPAAARPVDRITPQDLEQLYRVLLETPAGRGKALSPVSVRHCHAVLQNAFNDAVRHRRIEASPAVSAHPPRGGTVPPGIPDAVQIAGFLDDLARNNPALVDLALLILATGLRRSEALGLRFADIDWSAGRIAVRQVVIEVQRQVVAPDGHQVTRRAAQSQRGARHPRGLAAPAGRRRRSAPQARPLLAR